MHPRTKGCWPLAIKARNAVMYTVLILMDHVAVCDVLPLAFELCVGGARIQTVHVYSCTSISCYSAACPHEQENPQWR